MTICPTHLTCGLGPRGANLQKLMLLGAFLGTLGEPWLLPGDFSMPPEELAATTWLRQVGGVILRPPGTWTCSTGRVLDYVVASPGARALVASMDLLDEGGWLSHRGLAIRLVGKARVPKHLVCDVPKPFRHDPTPRAKPMDTSRRQAKLQKAAEARAENSTTTRAERRLAREQAHAA